MTYEEAYLAAKHMGYDVRVLSSGAISLIPNKLTLKTLIFFSKEEFINYMRA